ncbi:DUF6234 family protein [Streptomyces rubiginosohelvolus]|uniref:DUF6234 family protein n=1 Tax=Streptomyces rubiginosohelvolus TaxID=67362 RepID=UPI00386A73E1|nr:DUF6234 family protein [Streptomyces rubiginosohelvolus]
MTNSSVAAERWRPWSHPTPRRVDLAFAISLFLLVTAWLVLDWVFGLGMAVWAAQGDQSQIDAADLAHIGRTQVLLVVVLTVAVLAGINRAWRTVMAQVLAALLVGGVLMVAQHQWDTSHTSPGCIRYAAHC